MSEKQSVFSRRDFIKLAGTVFVGLGSGGMSANKLAAEDVALVPAAQGYLLVDIKKCDGCLSCMLTCSVVHTGRANLSLARIQVIQNPLEHFPRDLGLFQCRQCVDPACLKACPTGALYVNEQQGNMRMVDLRKCLKDCQVCLEACPYKPSRMGWDSAENHVQLCDLCLNAPYWHVQGGPKGKQACVEVCPMKAIAFTCEIPVQEGDKGYVVNLRGATWKQLGYPID